VVAAAHDLRGHVARGARSVVGVLGLPDPGNPQIRYPQVAFGIEDEVFGFEVAVDDASVVQKLEAE
jgi:hypothetical protein